jgi:hypothetical protein
LGNAQSKQPSLAARILDYLLEHPAAADSVRGVAEWWVGGKTVADPAAVEAALEALAARNLVQAELLADGTRLWSAGPALPSFSRARRNDG